MSGELKGGSVWPNGGSHALSCPCMSENDGEKVSIWRAGFR